jgi:hypothetical protein
MLLIIQIPTLVVVIIVVIIIAIIIAIIIVIVIVIMEMVLLQHIPIHPQHTQTIIQEIFQ